jgi:hypothetical protein
MYTLANPSLFSRSTITGHIELSPNIANARRSIVEVLK